MQYYPGHYKEQNISMCPKCKEKKKKKTLYPKHQFTLKAKRIFGISFLYYMFQWKIKTTLIYKLLKMIYQFFILNEFQTDTFCVELPQIIEFFLKFEFLNINLNLYRSFTRFKELLTCFCKQHLFQAIILNSIYRLQLLRKSLKASLHTNRMYY